LFRSQDLVGGGEGFFSNLELSVRVRSLVDLLNQTFEVSDVPLILVGEDDGGELFRGDTFSLASNNGSKDISGLLLGISVAEAIDDGGFVLGVEDVFLEDLKSVGSVTFESVGGDEGGDLVAVEGKSADRGLEESVSVVSETGTLHSDDQIVVSLIVDSVENTDRFTEG